MGTFLSPMVREGEPWADGITGPAAGDRTATSEPAGRPPALILTYSRKCVKLATWFPTLAS